MKRFFLPLLATLLMAPPATAQPLPPGTGNRMMWASLCGKSNVTTKNTKYYGEIGKLLISWRMLPGDTWDTAFDLYYGSADGTGRLYKLNTSPIVNSTCWQIASPPAAARNYYLTCASEYPAMTTANRDSVQSAIRAHAIGTLTVSTEQLSGKLPYRSIPLKETSDVCTVDSIVYPANDVSVGDLDGDGYDEIMYGSMAIDHDGYGLWTTRLAHGDANHVGKFLPGEDGLQVFHCLESGRTFRRGTTRSTSFRG